MKIGDRVRLSPEMPLNRIHKQYAPVRGFITACRGNCYDVKWDFGGVGGYHPKFLILEEPFPWRSHRTMAQVMADEQRPEPA